MPLGPVAAARRGCGFAGAADLVLDAEDYVRANPNRLILARELCAALNVSESVLRKAFLAVRGTSPARWIKRHRLALAREALLATPARRGGVKWVALTHGFEHFGQFSQDYKAVYGEPPSATLCCERRG